MTLIDTKYWCPISSTFIRLRFLVIEMLLLAVVWLPIASAVEPAEEFLKGLQQRGLHDLALEYLEQMKTSHAVDEEFRKQIPYHRGVVKIEYSRQTTDVSLQTRLLDEARVELEQFAETDPGSVQAAEAHLQLASMHMFRGQQLVAKAAQLPSDTSFDSERQKLTNDARRLFGKARDIFKRAEAIYRQELEKKPPLSERESNRGTSNQRQEYRARVAQLRFLAAQSQFEEAACFPSESSDYRRVYETAAQELSRIYDEFARTSIVGLYARLFEGRCYFALDQHQHALGCFEDILAQPNVLPPFRKLIASAVHRKAEVLLAQQKYDEVIATCQACLRDAKSEEEKLAEWLAVRFRLAEALEKKAQVLSANSLERRKLLGEARDAYRFVANTPGDFQSVARSNASAMVEGNDAEKNQPRDFKSAYDMGKEALASYNAARLALNAAEQNNPAAVAELKVQMEQSKEVARQYFSTALRLVEDDTDLKLLNETRYFLCWLYWEGGDYYRSAVLGEFLARRFPDHPAAASAAKIAMASFERLYNQASSHSNKNLDTDFESRRMAQMAEFLVRRWPESADAAVAQSVLVSYAIRTNRIDEAEKLLAGATPAMRPRLELQLGNAMWAKYLELTQVRKLNSTQQTTDNAASSVPSDSEEPNTAALAQLKQSAIGYLRSGFDQERREGRLSEAVTVAALYLAQALLDDEKYQEAVELLEDRQAGPLTLIARKHPAAARPEFSVEVYKAALRAYLSMKPPQANKARGILSSMEKALQDSGASEEQIIQTYIALGVGVQRQVEQLRSSGRDKDAARIAVAFVEFLDRISARQSDAKWPVRVWLAQMYYQMGVASRTDATATSAGEVANKCFTRSRDIYQQLLDDAAENPQLAPNPQSILAAKMQLGECYRALGQFKQALDIFADILKEKESSLSVQRAAAYTYQEWGEAENPEWLERAIQGGYKVRSTGQNRIWGWLKISQVAARAAETDIKYRDAFYEARINVARCRYLAAMKRNNDARLRDLAKAKQSIQSLAQLYPDLGGERWRSEFDELLKLIQTAAGQKPTGLREFSAASPQSESTKRRG